MKIQEPKRISKKCVSRSKMREIYTDVRAKKNKIIGQADDLSKVFG